MRQKTRGTAASEGRWARTSQEPARRRADGPGERLRVDMTNKLTYYLTMTKLNIAEAKTHLSQVLDAAAPGERILLCRRNVPVAELRVLSRPSSRALGLAAGQVIIHDAFFEPLPEDLLQGFEGLG